VTYLGAGRDSGGYSFAKVFLVDIEGTADVCVAHERDTIAKPLAPEIGADLKLPLEQDGLAPFDH
jgi:hypothetical protein